MTKYQGKSTTPLRLGKSIEEDAVFAEHTNNYWEQSDALNRELYRQVFSTDTPDLEAVEKILTKDDDFRETIGLSDALLRIYVVAGIALVTQEAIRRGVPQESAMEIRRRAFVALSETDDKQEWAEISGQSAMDLRDAWQAQVTTGAAHHPLVRKACTYIYFQRQNAITARDVADYLGTDRTYLARLFASDLGTTITDYILSVKMKEAAAWLQERKYTLPEIAANLGFSSYAYFSRRFKAYYGVSPQEYAVQLSFSDHPVRR